MARLSLSGKWSERGSRHVRGYGTAWDKLRARILADEPLCRACRARGRVTEAKHLDHITPKAQGGTDDESNLQPLCPDCHAEKSNRDRGFAIKGCDAHGNPNDPAHPWNA